MLLLIKNQSETKIKQIWEYSDQKDIRITN